MSGWQRSMRQNWATPASVLLHGAVVAGFLIQFSTPAPSLSANAEIPSLAVEVMILPAAVPDIVNTAPPPPPPPPPPMPEVMEEPPPLIETTADAAPPAPPPPPPKVKKRPEPPKPIPVKRPPRPAKEPVPVVTAAEPVPTEAPPAPPIPAPQAQQRALAAPAGRAGPPPSYLQAVSTHINRFHRVPSNMRAQRGRTMVTFVIDRQGTILSYRISQPSGIAAFDRLIPALMEKASPVPPMPADVAGETYELILPVDSNVR